jgi:ABC-type transport system involved in cytochrome c biogenesis permease subunit
MLVLVTLIGIVIAAGQRLGMHGALGVLDASAIGVFLGNCVGFRRVCGIRVPQLGLLEFLVVVAVLAILHGTALPGIST